MKINKYNVNFLHLKMTIQIKIHTWIYLFSFFEDIQLI